MLDKRLRCVAGLVRPGSVLADIGTDHAHLPVWLVKEGVCPRAVAADIRIGPAAAARHSVEAAGLEERIDVRVGDGLAPLCPGEADDIVIAGMGGETIASILEAAPWTKDGRYRLILQPMTRHECLRRFLLTGGFGILSEQIVQEGRRRYLVLACAYTGAPPVTEEAAYYIGRLPLPEASAYLLSQAARLRRQAQGLARRADGAGEAARLEAIAREMERTVRDNQ